MNLCVDCLEIVKQWRKENLRFEPRAVRKDISVRNYAETPVQGLSIKTIEKVEPQFGSLSDNDFEEPRAHLKELVKLGVDIRKESQLLEEIKIEAGPLDESCSEKFIESVNHMNEPIKEITEADEEEPIDVGLRMLTRSQDKNSTYRTLESENRDTRANKEKPKETTTDYRVRDLFELLVKTNQVVSLEFQGFVRLGKGN